jgi:hypothetical protein
MRSRLTVLISCILSIALPATAHAQERRTDRITPHQSGTVPDPGMYIRSVRVEPGTENVVITFQARTNTNATVEIGRRGERARSVRAGGTPAAGAYRAQLSGLRPDTEYTYAIYVPSTDPRAPHRLNGSFRTQRPAAAVAAREQLTERGDFHIRNVTVTPAPEKVVITFEGRFAEVPFVELGSAAPRRNLDGRYEFAADRIIGGYPAGSDRATGVYRVDASIATALQQGTVYHYIISAPSGDIRRPHQVTGQFTTNTRAVRLTFQRIEIISDSDATGAGELSFAIYVNDRLQHAIGTVRRNDGEAIEINREFVLENIPDRLVIHVEGYDDDEDGIDVVTNFGSAFKAEVSAQPTRFGPGRNSLGEWNVATREFFIFKEPLKYTNVIPAMSMGSSGSGLSFRVVVEVEILSR